MILQSLLKDALITQVLNPVVAGTSEQKSSVLDMQDYDGVCFVLSLGAVTDNCVLTFSAQGNTASSTSSPTPVAVPGATTGAITAATSSNLMMILNIYRPLKRYIFADLLRITQNAVINCIIAFQYNGRVMPVTQGTTVLASADVAGT